MASFEIVTEKVMWKRSGCYRLVFHLGHGIYQCFPSWKDFLQRDKKVDKVLSFVFEESLKQKQHSR